MNEHLLRAIAREREAGRSPWPMELHTCDTRVFRCELCGRQRPEEQRREPESEICIKCVEEAGFCS